MAEDGDDDGMALRPDTLALLREVLAARERVADVVVADVTSASPSLSPATALFGLSQFWYSEETCLGLAAEIRRLAGELQRDCPTSAAGQTATRVRVACISCPSTYKALIADPLLLRVIEPVLLEVDTRFAAFGPSYIHYDFNEPLRLPAELLSSFDVVAMDPPYLNAHTLGEFTKTFEALRRDGHTRLILCSGAVMLPHARTLLNARPVRFRIAHSHGLSNPFAMYVNYDPQDALGGYDVEAETAAERDSGGSASAAAAGVSATGASGAGL